MVLKINCGKLRNTNSVMNQRETELWITEKKTNTIMNQREN